MASVSKTTSLSLLYYHKWENFMEQVINADIIIIYIIYYKKPNPFSNIVLIEYL
jgi:hypothetical protein